MGVLLQGRPADMVMASVTAAIGVAGLAAGLGGWFVHAARPSERALLIVGGLLLTYAAGWADVAGLSILAVVSILHFLRHSPASTADNAR